MILPGMSGREIAKRVGSLRPDVKVLFMSGYTDDALIHRHGFEETFAFLQKPFSSDDSRDKDSRGPGRRWI